MLKRNINTLFALGIVCLISLAVLQYFWIKRIWNLKNRELDQLTHIALRETAMDLSTLYGHVLNETELIRRLSSDYYVVNINSQINPSDLEYYLNKNLQKHALRSDYEYGIFDCETNKMIYGAYINAAEGEEEDASISKELPTYDEFIYYFGIQFPNRNQLIFSELPVQFLVSVIFLLTLAFIVYSLYIILYQKRFMDLQKDFINSITHEFKTPITSLSLAGNLIKKHPEITNNKKLIKYSDIILDQSKKLDQHVNSILRLSKMERNELPLHKELCNLSVLLNEIVSSYEHRVKEKGGEITLNINASDVSIEADKTHLTNVIVNLLDNAIKYNDGTPYVNIDLEDTTSKGPKLLIKDNGIGIEDVDLRHVFKKFYRSKNQKTQKRNGFGLGLYYVKGVCDLHDWTIHVESKIQQGSTFSIQF